MKQDSLLSVLSRAGNRSRFMVVYNGGEFTEEGELISQGGEDLTYKDALLTRQTEEYSSYGNCKFRHDRNLNEVFIRMHSVITPSDEHGNRLYRISDFRIPYSKREALEGIITQGENPKIVELFEKICSNTLITSDDDKKLYETLGNSQLAVQQGLDLKLLTPSDFQGEHEHELLGVKNVYFGSFHILPN